MEKPSLTFFLKQVDPIMVAQSYLAKKLLLPKEKIRINAPIITQDLEYGDSYDSPAYESMTKDGLKLRIITTDHDQWKKGILATPYICHWCRIEHKDAPLGLPIVYEYLNKKSIYYVTGNYCSFECAYADLKTKQYCNFYCKDYIYNESEILLKNMYFNMTGKHKLYSAPHWTSHIKNGGILTDKDFYSQHHTYNRSPNIVLYPSKTSFVQIDK